MRRLAPLVLLALAAWFGGCRATPDRGPGAVALAERADAAAERPVEPRVVAVAEGDFAARSRAGEALVREGDSALDALADARDGRYRGRALETARLDAA